MTEPSEPRSGLTSALYFALAALLVLLVGLGVAAWLGGPGEPVMAYEGFN